MIHEPEIIGKCGGKQLSSLPSIILFCDYMYSMFSTMKFNLLDSKIKKSFLQDPQEIRYFYLTQHNLLPCSNVTILTQIMVKETLHAKLSAYCYFLRIFQIKVLKHIHKI